MLTRDAVLARLYNLILAKGTREWERSRLLAVKQELETHSSAPIKEPLTRLTAELRPLALRNNLTPDVADFYFELTGEAAKAVPFDFSKHQLTDLAHQERAIFAGGCFWCLVAPFEKHPGIISVLSGYTGGKLSDPTYDQVSSGYSGHVEAVEIIFDRRLISYQELVALYWQITDPTDAFGQFQDRGAQYRPIIFVADDRQRRIAAASKRQLLESGAYTQPIVTEIKAATKFWPAENYHQEFYKKQPRRYRRIQQERRRFLMYQRLRDKLWRIHHQSEK